MVTLDSVLTVAIGRNTRTGDVLDLNRWRAFRRAVVSAIRDSGGTIVADTFGAGVGSDGVNDGEAEESAVIVAINVSDTDGYLRRELASILRTYGASSACFAQDLSHEPVFADTPNGWRPEYSGAYPDPHRCIRVTGTASPVARVVTGVR